MVVAARYGYSVPPLEACICTKQNRAIWRSSPIVLRAPHGAICAILVLTTDVSCYKLTEQLVRWIASRLDAGDDSSTLCGCSNPAGPPSCGHEVMKPRCWVGPRPLHREQHRAAPLAADADALDEADDRQDDGAPDSDLAHRWGR